MSKVLVEKKWLTPAYASPPNAIEPNHIAKSNAAKKRTKPENLWRIDKVLVICHR
jgi:hypothetical protein